MIGCGRLRPGVARPNLLILLVVAEVAGFTASRITLSWDRRMGRGKGGHIAGIIIALGLAEDRAARATAPKPGGRAGEWTQVGIVAERRRGKQRSRGTDQGDTTELGPRIKGQGRQ